MVLDITRLRLLYLLFIWRGRGVCRKIFLWYAPVLRFWVWWLNYAEFLLPDFVCLNSRGRRWRSFFCVARENLQQAAKMQKSYYDRKARQQSFKWDILYGCISPSERRVPLVLSSCWASQSKNGTSAQCWSPPRYKKVISGWGNLVKGVSGRWKRSKVERGSKWQDRRWKVYGW